MVPRAKRPCHPPRSIPRPPRSSTIPACSASSPSSRAPRRGSPRRRSRRPSASADVPSASRPSTAGSQPSRRRRALCTSRTPGWNASAPRGGAAVDLDLVTKVDLLPARNVHFLYSPFEQVVHAEGWVKAGAGVDNAPFEELLRKHLREPFETEVAPRYAEMPLLIPLILEHIWGRFSSKHVWLHLQAKGASELQRFRQGVPSKALRKRGA